MPVRAVASAATGAAGIAVTAVALTAAPAGAQVTATPVSESTGPLVVLTAKQEPQAVTVRAGDSLSGIAITYCGNVADWTGLYSGNQKVIGANPNLIEPGQTLVLDCRQVHISLPAAGPAVTADVIRSTAVSDHAGTYSFSELEQLWEAEGGPVSVAWDAATIAECESGGYSGAYNPSGASGLWQILGSVVPGNVFDPVVNAQNAVKKFEDAGGNFSPWVCRA